MKRIALFISWTLLACAVSAQEPPKAAPKPTPSTATKAEAEKKLIYLSEEEKAALKAAIEKSDAAAQAAAIAQAQAEAARSAMVATYFKILSDHKLSSAEVELAPDKSALIRKSPPEPKAEGKPEAKPSQ